MQDTSTASTSPPAAVAAARGLLWLAEVCRDEGITAVGLDWSDIGWHAVCVRSVDDLNRLADRLRLSVVDGRATGCWADLIVRVYAIEAA